MADEQGSVVKVSFDGSTQEVEMEPELGLEMFQIQLFSLTGVAPELQQCPELDRLKGLSEEATSNALASLVGQTIFLTAASPSTEAEPAVTQGAGAAAAAEGTPSVPATSPGESTKQDSTGQPSDEELARKMQEEMDAALAASLQQEAVASMRELFLQQQLAQAAASGGGAAGATALEQRLRSSYQSVLQYEDPARQAKARALIPLENLQERAAVALARRGPAMVSEAEFREAVLKQLLVWFKGWFRWVDSPRCPRCTESSKSSFAGQGQPTTEDLMYGGHRVELHRCNSCGTVTRFVRYNDPAKLLETREGRCGEWANCFTLCCRALGYEAREVVDWTDHVWTECYSEHQSRWVHLDPCEAAFDMPLMYETGWGKKLSYVFGMSKDGVRDVIRRYTASWPQVVQRRNEAPESAVTAVTGRFCEEARRGQSEESRRALKRRDEEEDRELSGKNGPASDADRAAQTSLQGRQTGSLEWRAARGELGIAAGLPSSLGANAAAGTLTAQRDGSKTAAESKQSVWWREKEVPACDAHVGSVFLAIGDLCRDVSEAWGWLEPQGSIAGVEGAARQSSGHKSASTEWQNVKGESAKAEAVRRCLERVKAAQALVESVQAQPFRRRHVDLSKGTAGSVQAHRGLSASEARALLEACGMETAPSQERSVSTAASTNTERAGDGSAASTNTGQGALLSVKGAEGGKTAELLDSGRVALGLSVAAEALERAAQALKPLGTLPGDAAGVPKKGLGLGFLKWLVAGQRVSGGYVSADKENAPRELAINAVDGSLTTKWLHTEGGRSSQVGAPSAILQYRTAGGVPVVAAAYCLTSGDDCPERDPLRWEFMGSSDGGATWHVLDSRQGEQFSQRVMPRIFRVSGGEGGKGESGGGGGGGGEGDVKEGCTLFRLVVHGIRDSSSSPILQLTGFDIFAKREPAVGTAAEQNGRPMEADGSKQSITTSTKSTLGTVSAPAAPKVGPPASMSAQQFEQRLREEHARLIREENMNPNQAFVVALKKLRGGSMLH